MAKYAVGLSVTANSFFDPHCRANMFKSNPIYKFDHEPTKAIIVGIETGRLIDINKNIQLDQKAESVDVDKIKEQVKKELEPKLRKEIEAKVRKELEPKIRAEIEKETSKKKAE